MKEFEDYLEMAKNIRKDKAKLIFRNMSGNFGPNYNKKVIYGKLRRGGHDPVEVEKEFVELVRKYAPEFGLKIYKIDGNFGDLGFDLSQRVEAEEMYKKIFNIMKVGV